MHQVAVVGVTGAVGTEILRVMDRRGFPVAGLRALASERSAGQRLTFRGEEVAIAAATEGSFQGIDLAFFSAGATRSRKLVPAASGAGAIVVDNSSAVRMDPTIPLIVPEINGGSLDAAAPIVANPNCVAAILTMAVGPLTKIGTLKRMVVSTYQSASGAGARAMDDLIVQTHDSLAGRPLVPKVLKHPYAFNLFSHDSDVEANLYNAEENKVGAETRKILDLPNLPLSVTCVRVPVLRAHSMSVNIEFEEAVTPALAMEALQSTAGIKLVDDHENNHYPMPLEVSGKDDVFVGRVRRDPSCPTALNLFVCGDQLLKGAALNAVQIAEMLVGRA